MNMKISEQALKRSYLSLWWGNILQGDRGVFSKRRVEVHKQKKKFIHQKCALWPLLISTLHAGTHSPHVGVKPPCAKAAVVSSFFQSELPDAFFSRGGGSLQGTAHSLQQPAQLPSVPDTGSPATTFTEP